MDTSPAAAPPGPCLLCASREHRLYRRIREYRLLRCADCGLVFLDTAGGALRRPEQVFDEAYYASYGMLDPQWRRDLFAPRLAEMARLTPGRRLLDVGAGLGHLVRQAAASGFTATGVEPSVWGSDYGRRVLAADVRTGILQDIPFAPGSFDVVHVNHVLENIPDPAALLRHIRTLLAPAGILYLSVPNLHALARRFGDPYEWFAPQYRYYEFDRTTIVRLLAACGFSVRSVYTHDGSFNYRYWFSRTPAPAGGETAAAPAAPRTGLKHLVGELVARLGYGQSIIVIAGPDGTTA